MLGAECCHASLTKQERLETINIFTYLGVTSG